jgi:hypothetical protein
MGVLAFSGFLNRLVRLDPPLEQGRATVRLVWEALERENPAEAIDLMAYLIKELDIGHEIFARWTERMVKYLMEHDPRQTLRQVHAATMQPWLGTTVTPYFAEIENQIPELQVDGENVRYSWQNGAIQIKFHRQADTYPIQVFYQRKFFAPVHALDDSLRSHFIENEAIARQGIDDVLVRNRLVHELYCDWCWALLTNIRDTYGEERFGAAMRETMEDWIAVRYKDLVDMTPEEMLQLTVEGLRGEFFGAELYGDVEVTEEEDRYVLAFDPCGTGGRMRRGVPQLGTPPRTESPYNFGVSQTAHDWSWNEKGVCLYCTHCADINELMPLDKIGRPMRVTEHPKNPQDKCRWFIYKKPELIPDSVYERFGRKRPDHFIPLEQARTSYRGTQTNTERGTQGG